MTRKVLLLLAVSLVFLNIAYAQTRQISGKVVDGSGEPLVGVGVSVKNSTVGTQTNADGEFKLSLPAGNAILVFRYIGFKSKEIAVTNQTSINVVLDTESTMLDEVVAIGYQTVTRKDLTGSVSSVGEKQLRDIPINSTAEALAGRLAGVQIVQSEGTPGASAEIKVRGGGSITQDNSPLYVVDGVQVEDALSVLAPQDIESIDVLKDASATAIYGARGANGVVIVTTKGGKEMKPVVTYSGLVGVRKLLKNLDVMDPYNFVLYQYEKSRGNATQESSFRNSFGLFEDMELYKKAPFVNWQDEMFGKAALMQTHNVNLTGGTKETKYSASLTSNTEDGIQLLSGFDRKLFNLKLDQKISEKVKAAFGVRYNSTKIKGAGSSDPGSSSTNRLRHTLRYKPILSVGQGLFDYDADYDDETTGNSLALINPILLNEAEYRKDVRNTINLNGNVTYNFNKYLAFKTTVGADLFNRRYTLFNDTLTSDARRASNQPTAGITTVGRTSITNSNVLTFTMNKSKSAFSKKNKLDALIGQEIYENRFREDVNKSLFFPIGIRAEDALGNMSLGTPAIPTSNEYTERILSFFGRVSYSYADKYLFSGTLRADGSSKFAQGNKWGYFPSASFAWRLSEEEFFKGLDIKDKISDLKFRVSYGESGNNRIANFLYMTQYSAEGSYFIGEQQNTSFRPSALAYNDMKWETTIARNLGLDIELFRGRLQISADAYSNSTKDLLLEVPIPTTSGYSFQLRNAGETTNKGFELQISATPIQTKNFSWNTSFNLSHNKNKIVSIGESGITQKLYPSGWSSTNNDFVVRVGEATGSVWGYVTDGFYKIDDFTYSNGVYTLKPDVAEYAPIEAQPGTLKYKDISGPNGVPDGVIDARDQTIIGNTLPKYFGGLNQQFVYKNFDLSVFVNFQLGNDVYNANKLEFSSGYTSQANLFAVMNTRWRNTNAQGLVVTDPVELAALNENAQLWKPVTAQGNPDTHSWAIEDGSFLRINNITLGYTFPQNLLRQVKVNKLRVYGTVNNLAVITGYSGYDPEVNTRRRTPITSGVDYSAYPRSAAFIFGLNLTL